MTVFIHYMSETSWRSGKKKRKDVKIPKEWEVERTGVEKRNKNRPRSDDSYTRDVHKSKRNRIETVSWQTQRCREETKNGIDFDHKVAQTSWWWIKVTFHTRGAVVKCPTPEALLAELWYQLDGNRKPHRRTIYVFVDKYSAKTSRSTHLYEPIRIRIKCRS